jgi:hypothetical protein
MFESKKTQIIIAHQKDGIDRTKKSIASRQKKVRFGFRGFCPYFWEVDHPLCDV